MRVEINKNIILLYALLNAHEQTQGDPPNSKLRQYTINYFKDYKGPKPDVKKYVHTSKLVFWALCVGEAPDFIGKPITLEDRQEREFKLGSYIKPFLQDFYKNTDFEDYYKEVLPKLEEISTSIREMLEETDLEGILEDAWGIPIKNDLVIIPNPLSGGSFGPYIENTNYQVVSILDNHTIEIVKNLILHEGSHPIAKSLISPYMDKMEEKREVLEKVFQDENYPEAYKSWGTCYEEHLIRAVEVGFLLPRIWEDFDIEKALDHQEKNRGMIYIRQFYNVLKQHNNVKEALPELLELPQIN